MIKNKKGFTLVELLAVIVILGVILAIALPSITTLIVSQKQRAFESTALMLIKGLEYEALQNDTAISTGAKTVTNYGGQTSEVSAFSVTAINPTTVSLTGAGKFATCVITGRHRGNMLATGCN